MKFIPTDVDTIVQHRDSLKNYGRWGFSMILSSFKCILANIPLFILYFLLYFLDIVLEKKFRFYCL